jgi:hypothetical protein
LRNCGFFDETGRPGDVFTRESTADKNPLIDFAELPVARPRFADAAVDGIAASGPGTCVSIQPRYAKDGRLLGYNGSWLAESLLGGPEFPRSPARNLAAAAGQS